MASYEHLTVAARGQFTWVTLDHPERRNALNWSMLQDLHKALTEVADSSATGIVLAANGPVFCSGHDFADVLAADTDDIRGLLELCTKVMRLIHSVPQVVVARVHALAVAAGCQLVATCDLAVAGESAGFALPGGKGGWFCHTPAVPVARSIGRKRLMEMALTGDVIDARTAADWGLINRAVPDRELDAATEELLARATRGSPASKALGKEALYAQLDRPETDAYEIACEVMAVSSQSPAAREGIASFLEKRKPEWPE
ncbi:enoyl-CoA hydratase-related protein [Streptomyces carpinensis]|uniref:Enoyl-CoA hydratase domain-containing protein 3, mitochondrial n=1 Tax=Streptomyces carpinensis TaxID=66369 RepID=A0ABV1W2K9_9ACTN|nr:enoyl-CoA hydratase-related protein [Streptomyces carpinensis]